MNKLISYISSNAVVFLILNGLLYVFYGILLGLSMVLPVALVYYGGVKNGFNPLVFAVFLGIGAFLFLFCALFIFGLCERVLSIGFKPGSYEKDSPVFIRWIIYSGIHTLSINLILPFVTGSGFVKIYYKLIGCKFGEDVFINTVGLHDAYLLEIGNNVVIGGKADITCHTFENNKLTLKPVKIGNNVLIGANTYIMPGVVIGDNCDIGANALIRKNTVIKDNSLIMQLPAQPIKQIANIINSGKSRVKKEKIYS